MPSFVMRGYKGKTIGCAMSAKDIEIKGNFHLQGSQAVIPGEITELINNIFEKFPNIKDITINTNNYGATVYYPQVNES